MEIKEIVKAFNIHDECNEIPYINGYGKPQFVELHAIRSKAVWLDGEFTYKDLFKIAKALKRINRRFEKE